MAPTIDPALTVLTTLRNPAEHMTYAALSESSQVPASTLWHRHHSRPSRKAAAAKKQYLTPTEEHSLVDHILRAAERGYPIPVKLLRHLAWLIARQRSSTFQSLADDDGIRPPGKNWTQAFYKRHPELRPRRLKPLEWARHEIYDKTAHWFTVIGRELHDPIILAENVYNMDETGILLSFLATRKYVVHKDDWRNCRGVKVKRQLLTAMECISADGKSLSPLIIWPTSTHRSDWTTHPTPGWHFACSPSGYSNTTIVLDWYRQVFDPQTKRRANHRRRVLINDGFGPHESLEVMQFCYENGIILCRLPSHTSHKLQPCDVGVFGPLKTAYRGGVEELYRRGANTIGKQQFTLLYDQARRAALTPRIIKSGWAKAGLYLFNPSRVLQEIQKPPAQGFQKSQPAVPVRADEPLRTPVTSEQLVSLRKTVEQNMHVLDVHSQQCLHKLANAAERAMAARDLLHLENFELFNENNASSARTSFKSTEVGKAKIMSYEDISEARRKRDEKDAAGVNRRGRKRKSSAPAPSPCRRKKTRAKEIEEADREIIASGLGTYCSVF